MFYQIQFVANVIFVALIAIMGLAITGDHTAMQICTDFGNWLTQKGCEYGAFEGVDFIKQCGIKL